VVIGKRDGSAELREEVVEGLRYVHHQLGANTGKALEVASFLYALIELLIERGILTEKELNERKVAVANRLVEKFRELGMGAVFQEKEQDKYTFEGEVQIDCESKIHLCQAVCCKMGFALSRQDIDEGKLRWDLGRPYMIAKDGNGYCNHLNRASCRCTIWEHRPIPCRAYDCRNDKRIWIDFNEGITNPNLLNIFDPGGLK